MRDEEFVTTFAGRHLELVSVSFGWSVAFIPKESVVLTAAVCRAAFEAR